MSADLLLIDDNPNNLQVLGDLLREHGYRVRLAQSGRRGLEAIALQAPDVVLLDIDMPELDGYEVCRTLKQDPATAAIPVIFTSALDQWLDKVKAFGCGGADYVTKPFQVEEVVARVDNQLQIVRLQAAMQELNGELQRQTRAAEQSRAEAEDANRAKSQFVASVTHELRTPLNAIIGYSEMLVEQAEDVGLPQFVADLGRIRSAANHQLSLVNDILDLSKIEAGKLELVLEEFALAEAIESTRAIAGPLAARNSNTLRVESGDDLGAMRGDPRRVRQILFNLLSNACKFTDHGTVTLRVSRRDTPAPPHVTFEVRDTGVGMTEEQQRKLFQAFSQADASISRRFGGTGLGLAISQRLSQAMRGRIRVESSAGAGTAFTLELPVDVEAAIAE